MKDLNVYNVFIILNCQRFLYTCYLKFYQVKKINK